MPVRQRRCLISAFALASVLPTTFGTRHLTAALRAIEKVRATEGAAFQFAFPAWEAVIVQVPTPVRWTRAPLTVQRPRAANAIARPEEALARTVKSGAPTLLFASAAKEIVWLAFAIANVRATFGAAA